MSSVQDFADCPQCGYGQADYLFKCNTNESYTSCRLCGYCESTDQKFNEDGDRCGWKHEADSPAGVLFYRSTETGIFCSQQLPTKKAVLDAEQWLSEAHDKGQVDRDVSYLATWNRESQRVEVIVGKLYEFPEPDRVEREGEIAEPEPGEELTMSDALDGEMFLSDEFGPDLPF